MRQITPQQFLERVEKGIIKEVFAVERRVYGTDYTYVFANAAAGKVCELVWTDIP